MKKYLVVNNGEVVGETDSDIAPSGYYVLSIDLNLRGRTVILDEHNNPTFVPGVNVSTIADRISTESLAISGYSNLPNWARTYTASDASAYINSQIFSGMTVAQANAWIDTNITGTTVATLKPQLISALKLIAEATINMRDILILLSKLIIYIRDIAIRWR